MDGESERANAKAASDQAIIASQRSHGARALPRPLMPVSSAGDGRDDGLAWASPMLTFFNDTGAGACPGMWVLSARFARRDAGLPDGRRGQLPPTMSDRTLEASRRWIRVDSVPGLDHFCRLGFDRVTLGRTTCNGATPALRGGLASESRLWNALTSSPYSSTGNAE